MNEEEIEKIIEMTINKSNQKYINLKKDFDDLLSDYIELSRIEEKKEEVIEEVREYTEELKPHWLGNDLVLKIIDDLLQTLDKGVKDE